jgi:hypothetical protein
MHEVDSHCCGLVSEWIRAMLNKFTVEAEWFPATRENRFASLFLLPHHKDDGQGRVPWNGGFGGCPVRVC